MTKGKKQPAQQTQVLRRAILKLFSMERGRSLPAIAKAGQPFDALLLRKSRLYRKSRELYLKAGGTFEAVLVSSPRTLSSPTLLDRHIQYSPVSQELIWSATDPLQKRNPEHLLTIRSYVGSLFHEQNHRVLWSLLPPAPRDQVGIRRYLNWAESLVIAADMALGDELGTDLAPLFYQTGSIYDPGTSVKKLLRSRRQYRNYLQAAAYSTYLNLEFYDPKDIAKGIGSLFPGLGSLAERASARSAKLDRSFVWKTNPSWQKKHRLSAIRALSRGSRADILTLPDDPSDNRLQYLSAEKWFEALGL